MLEIQRSIHKIPSLFNLTQFKTILYLDSDTLAVSNVHELLELAMSEKRVDATQDIKGVHLNMKHSRSIFFFGRMHCLGLLLESTRRRQEITLSTPKGGADGQSSSTIIGQIRANSTSAPPLRVDKRIFVCSSSPPRTPGCLQKARRSLITLSATVIRD